MWRYVLAINAYTFLLFGYDKSQAVVGAWRIPEWQLWTAALAGGWVGAKAGQVVFRHKTRKQPFCTLLNMVPVLWIIALESFRTGLTRDILTQQASLMEERTYYLRKRAVKILQTALQNMRDTYREELEQMQHKLSSIWSTSIGTVQDAYTQIKARIGHSVTTPATQTWQRIRESVAQRSEQWSTRGTSGTKTIERLQEVFRRQPKNMGTDTSE